MILNILQLLLTLVIFIGVKYLVWYVTEGRPCIPRFLEYAPWSCRLCLGFWLPMAIFLSSGIIANLWITMAVGVLLTILDTIAFKIHIKNNTVSTKDIEI